jgi:NAD-dependent dihydropyrimidine dehydrogenase PreA subunit
MAYVITAACIGHKELRCTLVCPAEAIGGGGHHEQMYIDPDLCIQCGLCAEVCPVYAIYPAEDLPQRWRGYDRINLDYFRN